MTRYDETPLIERKLVVVSDICSSTTILEDLKRTDRLLEWRNFIIGLKADLGGEGEQLHVMPYNFIGDGWVLLFPCDISTDSICLFLAAISRRFADAFDTEIRPLLSKQPDPIGLMFGIDEGELIHLVMNDRDEYLGRAINVASRLQSITKELSGGPSYTALFSRNSFNRHPFDLPTVKVEALTVQLQNLSPPTIECLKFQTYLPPEKVVVRKRGGGLNPSRNYRSGL
jgi:hypothetical protein